MTGKVSYTSYPGGKTSDDEWLSCVPEHWDIAPLKRWVGVNEAVLPETTDPDFEFSYLEIGAVRNGQLVEQPRQIRFSDAPSRARRIVRQNDTIISTVRTYLKAVWFAGEVDDHLVCSTGFAVLTPRRGADPKFVSYLVRSELFTDRVTAESIGMAYPAISEGRLSSFHVCVPPFDEQTAIVRYLDHVDSRIQRYISAKERLIELLTEQKQAIINQAVTRGLDPTVRLKPSGVEWLGDVPAHWERWRLKTILSPVDRRSDTGSETLLSLRRDHGVVAYEDHFARPSQSRSLIGYKLVEPGQLVVNRLQANNGLVFCSEISGVTSPDYSVFDKRLPVQMQFLSDLLRTHAYRAYFRRQSTGLGTGTAGFLRLYDDEFLNTPVYLPPVPEQVEITEHARGALADIDRAMGRAKRQIDLMQEYRPRLISDVVTGKLDVRNAMDGLDQVADLVTAGSQHLELDVGR